jgi:hypothetical protein
MEQFEQILLILNIAFFLIKLRNEIRFLNHFSKHLKICFKHSNRKKSSIFNQEVYDYLLKNKSTKKIIL